MSNNEMKNEKEMCEVHEQKIDFICGVNEWHCEGLCIECIPLHTQKHNSNKLPINIQKIDIIQAECSKKVDQYTLNLSNLKIDFNELVRQYPLEDENMQNMNRWRKQIIESVNQTFDSFEQEYSKIYNNIYNEQKKQFNQIFEIIQKEEDDFKPLVDQITNIKAIRMTFKKNFEDKYKDILEKIKQSKNYFVTDKLSFSGDTFDKIKKLLPQLVTSIQEQSQQKVKEVQSQKRKSINQEKSHFCPDCGTQMNYVSDFKKHLVCPECVKIKRPNVLPNNKFGNIPNSKITKKI